MGEVAGSGGAVGLQRDGGGEEVKARWNRWATPKGDKDDSGKEHAGLQ